MKVISKIKTNGDGEFMKAKVVVQEVTKEYVPDDFCHMMNCRKVGTATDVWYVRQVGDVFEAIK